MEDEKMGKYFDLTIVERIEQAVKQYPNWSNAELRKLDAITEEIIEHCINGTGNRFIREWCKRNLVIS
jgi:hypothetical protein